MDLISRKAAIDACKEVSKQEEEHSKMWATGLRYAKKILTELPSVPAVPLEMISKKLGSLCKPCIFQTIGCPYKSFDCDSCNTSDAWEKAIRKWMGEEDAAD